MASVLAALVPPSASSQQQQQHCPQPATFYNGSRLHAAHPLLHTAQTYVFKVRGFPGSQLPETAVNCCYFVT